MVTDPTPDIFSNVDQSDLGLNIREAHAFNTNDGFSLDVFVVDQPTGQQVSATELFL